MYEYEKIKESNDSVLVLFSGGYDSLLSTCILLEHGYHVILVNYHACYHINNTEPLRVYKELKKFYKNIEYLGTFDISSDVKDNLNIWKDLNSKQILDNYGNITVSQLNCLSCRSAMYFNAIKYCIKNNIKYIAEGAKKSQLFAIEQIPMILEYKKLCNKYGIELLLPMYYAPDDKFEMVNILLCKFGYNYPIPSNQKCLLGFPFDMNDIKYTDEFSMSAAKLFTKDIEPKYNIKLKELR